MALAGQYVRLRITIFENVEGASASPFRHVDDMPNAEALR
jgi:hypothetical protein